MSAENEPFLNSLRVTNGLWANRTTLTYRPIIVNTK